MRWLEIVKFETVARGGLTTAHLKYKALPVPWKPQKLFYQIQVMIQKWHPTNYHHTFVHWIIVAPMY